MPNLPQPYEMRDWKAVARGTDSLMFDEAARGEYLPLVRFRRPYNGTRLQDSVFGVPSYVGDGRGDGLEAILTLPSVVSGLLMGIDKRDQNGRDYVEMTQDWFSRRDGEDVYLNLPLTSSGNDWWYETMPNVFFQHIYALAGPYGDAEIHFGRVAEQWSRVVAALGGSATPWQAGNFNYRSFRIRDLTPVDGGVIEPEAAGAIGYLLENAWRRTGEVRYRYAAEQALEFLDDLERNPRYELQLYYGAQAAARLNALENTSYDLEKMVGWTLSRGPLRQWGVSIAEAGGYDLHGLVGESEAGNDYLFYMNGAQAVGALAPIARYDNRFARTVGKYVLNVANNSRLFFWPYLPPDQQGSYDWASTYDPNGYLAYEALRERLNGKSPYATGDAQRLGWAPTDIGLYGSAHTGYLAAVVDTTDVRGVLALDLNATDFLAPPSYPTRLYYNPYDSAVTVTAVRPDSVGGGGADLYEAVSNQFVARDVTGDYTLTLPADEAVVLTWTPSGGIYRGDTEVRVDGIAIDYNTRLGPREGRTRIKAAAFGADSVAFGDTVQLHLTSGYASEGLSWSVLELAGAALTVVTTRRLDEERTVVTLRAGDQAGAYDLEVTLENERIPQDPDTASARIRVVPKTSALRGGPAPQALAVYPNPATYEVNLALPMGRYRCRAVDALGRTYSLGEVTAGGAPTVLATAALPPGVYYLLCTETRGQQFRTTLTIASAP